jgi:1-acyl-sn-glycerol-3-phosphate acyltransferase
LILSSDHLESIIEQNKRKKRRKEKRTIRYARWFNVFLKLTLGKWLKLKFNPITYNMEVFKSFSPPYFLISNHNCFWGPFILAAFVPDPVYYVVSDANFRSPIMNFLLGLVGSIPKSKVISDFDTIRYIMDIKKKKGVVGLFPEGQNSYDGHSLPIYYSSAKLIKRMGIPVVYADKRGSYLSFPRWAEKTRKGKVYLTFHLAFTPEDLEKMSVREVYDTLSELIEYDEFEFQKEYMIPFRGENRAHYLEILLFVCPHCHALASLTSSGESFSCTSCGYTVIYNVYGFFEKPPSSTSETELYFDNLREWNVWQLEYIESYLNKKRNHKDTVIFNEQNIAMHIGFRSEPMKKTGEGTLALYPNKISFTPNDNTELTFWLEKISGLNMHNEEKLELYYNDTLFRFDSEDKRKSMYKWFNFIQILKNPEHNTTGE